jgi:dihydromonapterin reductase/dihydrofolate reductase
MKRPILVTGVGQRAGLHLARTFLQRGWPLVGTYRRDRPDIAALRESGADLCRCDFYREGDLESLVEAVRDRYRGLRAIIHNASDWLSEDSGLSSEEVMQRMLRVHVQAPYQLNLALADLLQAAEGEPADIIHVGDYVSGRGSRKHIAYAASKAALDNLTLSFAARLAPAVKVNSIAPALLLFNEGDDQKYREKALAKSLLRREGGLDEFQRAVDYLLESDYVTGRILHLDGGRHIA